MVAFQPVASEDLWWWLSQGRQVISTGTTSPSADLLSEDDRGEASWLAGSVPAIAYAVGGASGLMLIRISVVAAIGVAVARRAILLGNRAGPFAAWSTSLVLTLAIISLAPYWNPVGIVWDLIAVGILAWLLQPRDPGVSRDPISNRSPTGRGEAGVGSTLEFVTAARGWTTVSVSTAALFCFWSNFGRFPVFGVGILGAFSAATLVAFPRHRSSAAARSAATILLAAVLGGSLNPIGWHVWIDSFVNLFPWTVASPVVVEAFGWGPLTRTDWELATMLFVALSLVWGWRRVFAAAPADDDRLLAMLAVQFCVWSSGSLVPLGVVWVSSEWMRHPSRDREGRPGDVGEKDDAGETQDAGETRHAAETRHAGEGRAGLPVGWSIAPPARFGVMAAVVGLALVTGSSRPPGSGHRFGEDGASGGLFAAFGWGIDSRLDPRHMELALSESSFRNETGSSTVFADDVRSAGMVAWLLGPPGPPDVADGGRDVDNSWRAQDHPQRALLGGRLADHHRLLRDLREGRQMRYWRDDGKPGGWWLALEERHTALIACSRRDVTLIRRLEPSIWKPLSLESPVLPYARAGDPRFTGRILEVLSQREVVDQRPWEYRPPTVGDSPYDRRRWGLELRDPWGPLSQARVFLAMELRTATLRVLSVARKRWPDDARFLRLWVRCQTELADQERLVAGKPSRFRKLASDGSGGADGLAAEVGQTTFRGSENDPPGQDAFRRSVRVYRSGGASEALRFAADIETSDGQLEYAKLCWMMESGVYDEALGQIRKMRSGPPLEAELMVLVSHRESELWWLERESATR